MDPAFDQRGTAAPPPLCWLRRGGRGADARGPKLFRQILAQEQRHSCWGIGSDIGRLFGSLPAGDAQSSVGRMATR